MKIYTKTGDDGTTSLFGGSRLLKSDLRIDSYGSIDELNSFVGHLYDILEIDELRKDLYKIQNILFNLGSILATTDQKYKEFLVPFTSKNTSWLESRIDTFSEKLPPLKNFILPSGHPAVSQCHIARTVCRRAERLVVGLVEKKEAIEWKDEILIFLNRLSDYFFILARYIAFCLGVKDIEWDKNQ